MPKRPSHPALNVRDDAYAPLGERGIRGKNHKFLKNGSEKFFAQGLDYPNQLEAPREIRFFVHAISEAKGPDGHSL